MMETPTNQCLARLKSIVVGKRCACSFFLGLSYTASKSTFSEYVSKEKMNIHPVAILLATTSEEYFQAYRLANALIYLQRNGVNTGAVRLQGIVFSE